MFGAQANAREERASYAAMTLLSYCWPFDNVIIRTAGVLPGCQFGWFFCTVAWNTEISSPAAPARDTGAK